MSEESTHLLTSNNHKKAPPAAAAEDEEALAVPQDASVRTTTSSFFRSKGGIAVAVLLILFAIGLIVGLVVAYYKQKPDYEPTVILISIDGFRFDYLDRGHTPNLSLLAKEGVRASNMAPIFPSKTFPNHYTIVTGLYAEDHGIVANTFYDPVFNETFQISDPDAVTDAKWWGGEPFWNTVEFSGQKSACCFWPGSEAPIQDIRPSYYLAYDESITNDERVTIVVDWLKLPKEERPTFITLYFSDVDTYGHSYGPDSPKMEEAMKKVDDAIGLLISEIDKLKLTNYVNIIVVSDHGMTANSREKVVFLDDIIDLSLCQIIDWSPITSILPNNEEADALLYEQLVNASLAHPFGTYRPHEIPEEYHYSDNRRIMPIILIAELGWEISSRSYFDNNPDAYTGGTHGYDNRLSDMQSIFLARGPAFKSGGLIIDAFDNIEVYNMLTVILDVPPAPNNGTFPAEESQLVIQALKPDYYN